MDNKPATSPAIKQTIPLLAVSDMEASLRFYEEGLGFEIINKWVPQGKVEWCCLQRDGGTIMLQQLRRKDEHHPGLPDGKLGLGVSIFFLCEDALAIYCEVAAKSLPVAEPFVGNGMWVVALRDPDDYSIEFESYTDVPEETRYTEWKK